MKQKIFPIICIIFIAIGAFGLCKIAFTEEKDCTIEDTLHLIKENNNKIDGLMKAIVSAEEEKENLIRENVELKEQIDKYVSTFVSEPATETEHNVAREPGQLTEDGSHQEMPPVDETITESHERFKELAKAYGLDAGMIREVENHYGITEGVILCIAVAETSGGKFGAGTNNIGNVGNTDSNPRGQSYSNVGASLDAIGRTLTNGYLGGHTTLGCLSNAGSCIEPNDNGKRYASSNGNRERNMSACLGMIYNTTIEPSNFIVRR